MMHCNLDGEEMQEDYSVNIQYEICYAQKKWRQARKVDALEAFNLLSEVEGHLYKISNEQGQPGNLNYTLLNTAPEKYHRVKAGICCSMAREHLRDIARMQERGTDRPLAVLQCLASATWYFNMANTHYGMSSDRRTLHWNDVCSSMFTKQKIYSLRNKAADELVRQRVAQKQNMRLAL